MQLVLGTQTEAVKIHSPEVNIPGTEKESIMTKAKEQVGQCCKMKLEKWGGGSYIMKNTVGYLRVQIVCESTREPWKIVKQGIT